MIPLGFFAAVVVIVYIYYSGRNKERLALIEKNTDANKFKMAANSLSALKLGVLLMGLGIGFVIANIIDNVTALEPFVAYASTILLFGGGSLVLYFQLEKKFNSKNQEKL